MFATARRRPTCLQDIVSGARRMNTFYTRVFAGGLFPLHERLKGHSTLAVRKRMEETQWWSAEGITQLQLQRLRGLLSHAGENVPYYQRVFAERGFDPASVMSLRDLEVLPLLDKPAIRAQEDALKSRAANGLARMTTGGSSGEPLQFWLGKERVSHDVAAKWRATRWWGVDIGDPEIVLWGSPIELGRQDWVKQLRDRLQRSVLLPAFEMSDDKVRHFVRLIRARRPRMLFGYPSALSYVAGFAEGEGIRLDDFGCRVAFATGEALYDHQRERIGRVFGCPVANGYGGRDAGFIAHQCPEGGLHITAEDVVVEVLDPVGNPLPIGESGELVITHLATRDFPFIRYRTGDMGALDEHPCSCGRGLPLIRNLEGRTTDFIVAADGTVMHGLALIYVIRALAGVRSFRIIQENRAYVRVLLSVDACFDQADTESIRTGFRARLGQNVDVQIEQVDNIPVERSGKYRYVVSRVAPEQWGTTAA